MLRYAEEVVRVRVREVEREVVGVMWPTHVEYLSFVFPLSFLCSFLCHFTMETSGVKEAGIPYYDRASC